MIVLSAAQERIGRWEMKSQQIIQSKLRRDDQYTDKWTKCFSNEETQMSNKYMKITAQQENALWKSVWKFHKKKQKTEQPYDLSIYFLKYP